MKIIHILLGKANPNKMNGVNVVVHNIATELTQMNIDVEVWGLSNNSKIRHEHIYSLVVFQTNKLRFLLDKELKKAIDSSSKDTIFHLHSVFLPELIAISNYLRKRGFNWIHTPHGQYIPESLANNWKKSLFMNLFEKKFIRGASITHAIGNAEVAAIKKDHLQQKIVLIPNGFSIIKEQHNKKYNKDELIFGYCGRISIKQKGLDIFMEAFSQYKKNKGLGKCIIIGDGPDKIKLENEIANLGITQFVEFKGSLFGIEKIKQLHNFTYFIHPSRWDGIPTGVLEASALGIPLLISKETNLLDYVEEYGSGIGIKKATTNNILISLEKAQTKFINDDLSEFSDAGIKMIEEKLNWTYITKQYLSKMYLKVGK